MTNKLEKLEPPNTRIGAYQAFMLALCIYALILLAADVLVPLSPETRRLLEHLDTAVCALFFLDFLLGMARAQNRWRHFLRWGWMDLISSVPAVNLLRIGRFGRVVRIIRLLRGFRAAKVLASFILERRAESSFLAATLIATLTISVAAVAILHCESAPDSNIKSAEDALWWAATTITTVGYGDRFPVTTEGRCIGVGLMAVGVGVFGTLAGLIASWVLNPSAGQQEDQIRDLRATIDRLSHSVDALVSEHQKPKSQEVRRSAP